MKDPSFVNENPAPSNLLMNLSMSSDLLQAMPASSTYTITIIVFLYSRHLSYSLCLKPSARRNLKRCSYQRRGAKVLPYRDRLSFRQYLTPWCSSSGANPLGRCMYTGFLSSAWTKALLKSMEQVVQSRVNAMARNKRTVANDTTGEKDASSLIWRSPLMHILAFIFLIVPSGARLYLNVHVEGTICSFFF